MNWIRHPLNLSFLALLGIASAAGPAQGGPPVPAGRITKKGLISCSGIFGKLHDPFQPGLVSEDEPANTVILGYAGRFDDTLLSLYSQLSPDMKVILIVVEKHPSSQLLQTLRTKKNVTIVETNNWGSAWVRDWVPQKVVRQDGSIEFVNLTYTAKSFGHQAPERFAKAFKLPHYQSPLIGELGNIMVDGKRRLFTTQKMITDNLDQGLSRRQIIDELKKAFEAKEVHVLPEHPRDGGIGHVDLVAKYLGRIRGKETVVVSQSKRPEVNAALDQAARKFESLRFEVIRVEEFPERIGSGAAGFVNSVILNGKLYMPTYSGGFSPPPRELLELEQQAKRLYESLGFEVLTVDSSEPIRGMGAIHCLTCTGTY